MPNDSEVIDRPSRCPEWAKTGSNIWRIFHAKPGEVVKIDLREPGTGALRLPDGSPVCRTPGKRDVC
jgi:hypothetical protein